MQLIKWYFLLIGALSNKHTTSNIYFSVSMKNWSKFQTIYLTNSERLPGAMNSTPSLPLFFLFCYILITSGFLTNTNQCKTFTKLKKINPHILVPSELLSVCPGSFCGSQLCGINVFGVPHPFSEAPSLLLPKEWKVTWTWPKTWVLYEFLSVRITATAWLSGQHTKSTNKTSYIILQG